MTSLIRHETSVDVNSYVYAPLCNQELYSIDISLCGLINYQVPPFLLLMLVMFVAAAKIMAVKAGTLFKLACLPCQPTS
jgi:hypothetical protein